jgi:hypothetical protein
MLRLTFAAIFLLFTSCSKDKTEFSLIGKWQLIESYNGMFMAKPVPPAERNSFEFKLNGTYVFTPAPVSSLPGCNGTYEQIDFTTVKWDYCGNTWGGDFVIERPYLTMQMVGIGGGAWLKYQKIN